MLLHLPRMDGYGVEPRVKNGPALAGYGAEAMRDAIAATITTLPEQLRRSLTWDRGKELAQHAQLQDRHRARGLLRRPAQPMAARHEREHQRTAAPVLPEGHRPVPMERRRARGRRRRAQQPGPARPSAGRHPPKPSTSTYSPSNKPVLRRPVESGQYLSIRYTERLAAEGAVTSVGSLGDSYDNAMAESIIGLYKSELITMRGPWRTVDDVELATLSWVHWWNTSRLHSAIGHIPPDEFEAAHYAHQPPANPAGVH